MSILCRIHYLDLFGVCFGSGSLGLGSLFGRDHPFSCHFWILHDSFLLLLHSHVQEAHGK